MAGGSCYFTRLVRFYFMAGKFGGPALRRFCCFWVQMPISREGIGRGGGWGRGENLGGGGLFKKKKNNNVVAMKSSVYPHRIVHTFGNLHWDLLPLTYVYMSARVVDLSEFPVILLAAYVCVVDR